MNFFKTLLRPDREELEFEDKAAIAAAANLLQIGEFQFLQLAYREWHGEELPDAKLDLLFDVYMLRNDVPHWARHYARKIMMEAGRGELDDRNPEYHRYDSNYIRDRRGSQLGFSLAVVVLLIFVGGGVVMAELAVGSPAGILPPYFDNNNLIHDKKNLSWGRSDSGLPP